MEDANIMITPANMAVYKDRREHIGANYFVIMLFGSLGVHRFCFGRPFTGSALAALTVFYVVSSITGMTESSTTLAAIGTVSGYALSIWLFIDFILLGGWITDSNDRLFDELCEGFGSEAVTVVDQQIGKPVFALNFIARPDGDFRHQIAQKQAALAADLPAGVFTCPLDSLHLTVAPIIWARGTYDFDVQQWWASNAEAATNELARLAGDSSAFKLTSAELEVHPGAIVLRLNPSSGLNALRQAINASPEFKDIIVETINFTHVTLFRFEEIMPISDLAKVVERHAVPRTNWAIDELILCQEEVYPSLQYTDITSIRLAG